MFLSKREKGLLRLLLEQTNYLPASFFQKKLYVSAKTIYTDLSHLEEKLAHTGLVITRLPRKGIRIDGTREEKQKAYRLLVKNETILDKFSPEYRKLAIFSQYLFGKKLRHYQEFASYFYVSYQSIKKDVDEILLFCQKRNVQGRMTPNGLQLIAAETVCQRTFKAFLEKTLDFPSVDVFSVQKLFDDKNVQLVARFVAELSLSIGRQLNSYFVESLEFSLEIFLARLQKGFHVEQQENLVFEELKRMKLYMMGTSFSEIVAKELGLRLTDSDIQYVCSLLVAHEIEPYMKISERDQKISVVTREIIFKMSELLKVDLKQDELLLQALLSHIVPMIHRLKQGMSVKNPLLKNIKKQYSTMFTLTKFVIDDLEKEYAISLTEDEVSFLTIHFQLAFEKVKVTKHILIVCSSGLATSELIFNRIKQTISADVVLEIINADKLASTSLKVVDLIISTIPLDEVEVQVLYVSALPTPEEMAHISSSIANLSDHEKRLHVKEYQNSDLLRKYLDKEFLFVKKHGTKEEILSFLAQDYQAKELVTDEFKQSLFAREDLGSTGLKTGVAIPHADPKTVKETKLAFLTLDSAVKWGNTEVQLVVLLAIAEANMTEAKELIASIYDLFNSPEEIKWVVDSEDKEALYRRLLRGGKEHVF